MLTLSDGGEGRGGGEKRAKGKIKRGRPQRYRKGEKKDRECS
jgi:hypothetical protein